MKDSDFLYDVILRMIHSGDSLNISLYTPYIHSNISLCTAYMHTHYIQVLQVYLQMTQYFCYAEKNIRNRYSDRDIVGLFATFAI